MVLATLFTNNMADWKMVDFDSSVFEGEIKFREKKKWKRRWCILRRLSPVANSLTMQLYKKSSGWSQMLPEFQAKATLNLEHLLGLETNFLLCKESQTIAIICKSSSIILAFDRKETLLEWQARITEILGQSDKFEVQLLNCPSKFSVNIGIITLHIRDWQFSLIQGIPPRLLGSWNLADLRKFGAFDDYRFCFEGGSRCCFKGGEGVFVLGSIKSREIGTKFELAARGRLSESQRIRTNPTSSPSNLLTPLTRRRLSLSARGAQSTSKPCTPLLSSHRRTTELCLSPPCTRHFRSALHQHSRHSSFSSSSCRLTSNSALQQSDPEILYDKPRSINAVITHTTVVLEAPIVADDNLNSSSRPSSALPSNHYDTPRRVLQGSNVTSALPDPGELPQYGGDQLPALYATVVKPKQQASTKSEPDQGTKFHHLHEVEGYLVMQRYRGQWPEYVRMQALSRSPTSHLTLNSRKDGQHHSDHYFLPAESTATAPLISTGLMMESVGSNGIPTTVSRCRVLDHQYQNANAWMQLSRSSSVNSSGDAVFTHGASTMRCSFSKSNCHSTLPLVHSRGRVFNAVNLRLRRSASLPCRQRNRDSSDSTDSGVSVTTDSGRLLPVTAPIGTSGCSPYVFCCHMSLPRPTDGPVNCVTSNTTDVNTSLSNDSANIRIMQPWTTGFLGISNDNTIVTDLSRCFDREGQDDVNPSSRCRSISNCSDVSHLLDQLETLSVASTGYETSV